LTLRSALRAPLRVAAIGTVTVLIYVLVTTSTALAPGRRRRRAVRHFYFRAWSLALCRLLGIRIQVEGEPPHPPCLLVTNHVSYVDVLVLASLLPARFVAKSDISGWPAVGAMCRSVDTFFIDRSSRVDAARVGRAMGEALAAGDAIVLFPESTSTHGHRLAPFRPTLLAPAAAAELPVHYGALHYRTPEEELPAHLAVCWWGEMPFFWHARRLLRLSRVDARVTFGREPIRSGDRKVLAARLQEAVGELFVPLVDIEPTDWESLPDADQRRAARG
jgi:1-acyl-sn-glycerol-3-phosphate acyltransferase